MPAMDGAALLARVKELHPASARIILSGHSEQEAAVRALPVAHRFLSKPCDADTLRRVIEETCQLQSVLSDEAVRSAIGRIDKLPSTPKLYHELLAVSANPDAGAADFAKIIEKDAAMSIKILQIVNSAYFGLAQKTTSVLKAIAYLGIELLKGLTLAAHVFTTKDTLRVPGLSLEKCQESALLTARLARRFARDSKQGEEAFAAGIVHDVGRIVLALSAPQRLEEILTELREAQRPIHEIEAERFGVTHAELGAYLLGVWGLPFPVVRAVAYHHTPGLVTEGSREVLAALHVADALVDTALEGESKLPEERRLDLGFLESAGFSSRLSEWRAMAEEDRTLDASPA